MPAITASAPGKIILFGEHAVVYGRPAIAVPVSQVQARATVMANPAGAPGQMRIQAPDVRLDANLDSLPPQHPIGTAVHLVLQALGISRLPACTLRITSTIPVAAGLGSGAAVSVATIRAVAGSLGRKLPPQQVSALAYEVEKLHHGTPSGIDNTVITYAMPVYFVRPPEGSPSIETFPVPAPFTLVIGDTGVHSPTAVAVSDLRKAWQMDPDYFELLFDHAGQLALAARRLIEAGEPLDLGPLMDENHAILRRMGVSSPELDRLVAAARAAGALGAKLSGGGRGGNMIALVEPGSAAQVAQALIQAGAKGTLVTQVGGGPGAGSQEGRR